MSSVPQFHDGGDDTPIGSPVILNESQPATPIQEETKADATINNTSAVPTPATAPVAVAAVPEPVAAVSPPVPVTAPAAAASAPSSSAPVATAADSAQAAALSNALFNVIKQLIPTAPAPTSLSSTLAYFTSLAFEIRSSIFSLGCSNVELFRAIRSYLLSPSSSPSSSSSSSTSTIVVGSREDPVCEWLYESYWTASSKLTASPTSTTQTSVEFPAHMFVCQLLPTIIEGILFTQTATPTSTPIGLFAIALAVYNTERVLSARDPSKSLLATDSSLPSSGTMDGGFDWIKDLPQVDLAGRKHTIGHNTLSTNNLLLLPSIIDPTTPHFNLLIHVCLKKCVDNVVRLSEEARQTFIYLIGITTNSGNGSNGRQLFGTNLPTWFEEEVEGRCCTTSSQPSLQRLTLSTEILQDYLLLLTDALKRSTPSSGTTATQAASSSSPSNAEREFLLIALRQLHCRAIEELKPEILLQTTVLLDREE